MSGIELCRQSLLALGRYRLTLQRKRRSGTGLRIGAAFGRHYVRFAIMVAGGAISALGTLLPSLKG